MTTFSQNKCVAFKSNSETKYNFQAIQRHWILYKTETERANYNIQYYYGTCSPQDYMKMFPEYKIRVAMEKWAGAQSLFISGAFTARASVPSASAIPNYF
jgi:hypothetical protein